jgi:hypothetical protein
MEKIRTGILDPDPKHWLKLRENMGHPYTGTKYT